MKYTEHHKYMYTHTHTQYNQLDEYNNANNRKLYNNKVAGNNLSFKHKILDL